MHDSYFPNDWQILALNFYIFGHFYNLSQFLGWEGRAGKGRGDKSNDIQSAGVATVGATPRILSTGSGLGLKRLTKNFKIERGTPQFALCDPFIKYYVSKIISILNCIL